MPSYLRYNDVAAVIGSANQLAMIGTNLQNQLGAHVSEMRRKQGTTIKGGDSYSTGFLEGYRKPGEDNVNRDEAIFANATEFAEHAAKVGPAVLTAATDVLYVDALNGAAMLRASNASA